MDINISNEDMKAIVSRVVAEYMKQKMECAAARPDPGFAKQVDSSGIIHVSTDTVKCEPFGGQEGVYLKDILTLDEAPRMGAGIMELDHTSFEWTLTYDEYDYVISGHLEIEIDGRVVTGKPGDIIYIPKGSHIHFQTPDETRYAYFVYPANWSEL